MDVGAEAPFPAWPSAGRGAAWGGLGDLLPPLSDDPLEGPPKASVSLRTTGASIVEDAERTNSPSSWSLAMTTLLSTPNSLASSYTRTFATSLLLVRGGRPPDLRYFTGVLIAYSSSAHRNLDLLPTREVPDDHTHQRAIPCRSSDPPSSGGGTTVRCSTHSRSTATSSDPWTRKARGNARRRTARSRHVM